MERLTKRFNKNKNKNKNKNVTKEENIRYCTKDIITYNKFCDKKILCDIYNNGSRFFLYI